MDKFPEDCRVNYYRNIDIMRLEIVKLIRKREIPFIYYGSDFYCTCGGKECKEAQEEKISLEQLSRELIEFGYCCKVNYGGHYPGESGEYHKEFWYIEVSIPK